MDPERRALLDRALAVLRALGVAHYDCVLCTVGAGGPITYAKEAQLAGATCAAMRAHHARGGVYAPPSDMGCA